MKRVIVHVERLVLRGFGHEERHAVAAGLERELGRLLAEPGAADRMARLGHIAHLRPSRISVAADVGSHGMGVAAARAIDRKAHP